jgi:hypothetical protein
VALVTAETGEAEGFSFDQVDGTAAVEGLGEVVVAGGEVGGEAVGGTEEPLGTDVVSFYWVISASKFIGEFERSFCG